MARSNWRGTSAAWRSTVRSSVSLPTPRRRPISWRARGTEALWLKNWTGPARGLSSRSLWTKRLARMRCLMSLGWPRAKATKGSPAGGSPRSCPVRPTEGCARLPVLGHGIPPGWPSLGSGWAGRLPSPHWDQQEDLQDRSGLPHQGRQTDQGQCLYWLRSVWQEHQPSGRLCPLWWGDQWLCHAQRLCGGNQEASAHSASPCWCRPNGRPWRRLTSNLLTPPPNLVMVTSRLWKKRKPL